MIRKLERADREDYLSMATEFYASDVVLAPVPRQHMERTFEEMMRSDLYALGYALEHEGEMVGYALLAKTFSQEAGGMVLWVEELYVREHARGCGLGREFFAFLEELSKEQVARVRLEVEEENEKAVALYKEMGFEWLEYKQMVKNYPVVTLT